MWKAFWLLKPITMNNNSELLFCFLCAGQYTRVISVPAVQVSTLILDTEKPRVFTRVPGSSWQTAGLNLAKWLQAPMLDPCDFPKGYASLHDLSCVCHFETIASPALSPVLLYLLFYSIKMYSVFFVAYPSPNRLEGAAYLCIIWQNKDNKRTRSLQ